MTNFDRTTQDVSNLLSLDHVNLTIPDQQVGTLFYVVGLGFTRDPYLTVGLVNMWMNLGYQQFHLPTNPKAQVLRGRIGLVMPDLDQLEQRLSEVADGLAGTRFSYERGEGFIDVVGPWGNEFRCHPAGEHLGGVRLGLEYLILNVPSGTAEGIVRFYSEIIGASATLVERRGAPTARVQAGGQQALLFREDPSETRPYDGHHIAVYISDFSGPHTELERRGLITEESNDSQYRFKSIVDPKDGRLLYEFEHEVRSMVHPMYGRELVNRDPVQTQRDYRRGADALLVG